MGDTMKVLGPLLGVAETGLGVATVNPALIGSGIATTGGSIASALSKPPEIPKLSATMPTQATTTPDLSALLGGGGGGGGLGGQLSTSSMGVGPGGGGGTAFGSFTPPSGSQSQFGGSDDVFAKVMQMIMGGRK